MKTDKLLFIFAIVAVITSIVGVGITFGFISVLQDQLTGFAAQSGDLNITVESVVIVNFTTDDINWGTGEVSSGEENATLNTAAGGSNITNGNWTGNTAGLVIENIGNSNVSINISTGKNASSLLSGTSPLYEYNISYVEINSCLNTSGGTDALILDSFISANATKITICDIFDSNDNQDSIRIDIKLVIPSDSSTGSLSDTLTVQIASA